MSKDKLLTDVLQLFTTTFILSSLPRYSFSSFLYTAWRQQAHIKQHFARFACTISSTLYSWGESVHSFNLQTIQQDIHIAGSIHEVHIHYSYQGIVPKRKYGFSATIILVHKLVQQSKLYIQHVAQCR